MPHPPITPVFDIGGVLLEWNPRHLYRKLFAEEAPMEEFLATVCTPAWNLQMDAGREWGEAVAELAALHPDRRELIEAYHLRWEEMVPHAIEGTVAILRRIKASGRPVYAITNFSAEKLDAERRRWDFLDLFDGVVVSSIVRLVKPDAAIFRCLLDAYGLAPAATVFIDDNAANVEGARAVGMQAIRFTSPDALEGELISLGVLDPTA
jgi:2-haloacid dehalogenase